MNLFLLSLFLFGKVFVLCCWLWECCYGGFYEVYNLGDFVGCEYLDFDEVNLLVILLVKIYMIGFEGLSFEFEVS